MTRKAESRLWFQFAEDDLRVAQLALREGIYTQACFHAQQAVEKVLKGLWVCQGKRPPRTHALLPLWEGLTPNPLQEWQAQMSLLTLFYSPSRYPDAIPGSLPEGYPGRTLAEDAVKAARQIFHQAAQWLDEVECEE